MDAIEGDGTPLSYLSASFLSREIADFGAMWHGLSWSTHSLVARDPFTGEGCCGLEIVGPAHRSYAMYNPGKSRGDKMEDWAWMPGRPSEWRPLVRVTEDSVEVVFHTHSALGQARVFRYVDTFAPGSYRFETQEIVLAEGSGGYCF